MRTKKCRRFEALENRLCLSVSVAVNDGDLVVSGDADGAVEIVAVGAGACRVTDLVAISDTVTLAEAAVIADNFFARLGEGDNTVIHSGNVAGDFRVVSANEDDTVDIGDAAVIGGATDHGLGEQEEYGGGCGGYEHSLRREFGGSLGTLALNGRNLGFFYRGFRR